MNVLPTPRYRAATFAAVCFSLLVCCVAARPAPAAAQVVGEAPIPADTIFEIRLTDGSTIYGRVVSLSENRVAVTTVSGVQITLDRSQIRNMEVAVGRLVEGEFWQEDPNGTRLYFSTTGRSLSAGEGYVGTYFIVLPFVAVGVTDAITIAGGAPVLAGEFEPFYLAPKVRIVHTNSADISLGTLIFFFDDENVGIAYGVGTFGSADQALTLGLGFGYSGADFSSQPVAMIGAETRVSRRVKLLTENYFLPGETGAVLMGGIRIIGERFATDLGIVGAAGEGGGGCCLPIVNFSYAFGGGR